MPKPTKQRFLQELTSRFSTVKRLGESLSLFDIGGGAGRVYVRYSKLHPRGQAFYGLRQSDLKELEGHPSVICFLWDEQESPLVIPYSDYECIFHEMTPADDGQFKVQVFPQAQGTEFYIARAGRFNVESFYGWATLESLLEASQRDNIPELSHSQVQTLLGAIGASKGFHIWVPRVDRGKLDWDLASKFHVTDSLPSGMDQIKAIVQEIDVIWLERGSGEISALYEVEHSTPIYSGLLRFNDVHLVAPSFRPRFGIVSNDVRREAFVRQVNRPTFQRSGLIELCSFLEYANVFGWHKRQTRAAAATSSAP